jgi:cation transport ATPase
VERTLGMLATGEKFARGVGRIRRWATGYNALAILIAAGVLDPAGILLTPAAGAVLMSLSTVIVASRRACRGSGGDRTALTADAKRGSLTGTVQ